MLWPILALMTIGAAGAVCWPLFRRQAAARSGNDIAVYRDQLQEIDHDETTDLIGKAEADAARVEVSRRLIAAAENAKSSGETAPEPHRWYRRATAVAAIVLLPLGAGSLYFKLGSPNLNPISMVNAEASRSDGLPDGIEQTVAEVEAFLQKNPGNGRGWELLAPVYIRLGRFDAAVNARRKALEIFGPDAARLGDLGEAIYMAAGGVVTPEAKELFLKAEATDSHDVMAQYYLGVSDKQEGRRDEAAKRWNALIAAAPPGAEYLPLIQRALAQIDQASPQPQAAAGATPAAGAAPAAGTTPEHDGNSVEAMVERLAQRLQKDGSDVNGWVQLLRSYRVLGKTDKLTAAIAQARAALANNPQALSFLEDNIKALDSIKTMEDAPGAAAADSAPPAAPSAPATGEAAKAPPEHDANAMVERLAARLKANGSDVQGWLELIRSYRVLNNPEKATAAIADARAALAGSPDALRTLDDGVKAIEAGAQPGAPTGAAAGDAAAAAKGAPPEHDANAMVERLAARLKTDGSDVQGWIQLIRSYRVLKNPDKASAAIKDARAALAGNPDALLALDALEARAQPAAPAVPPAAAQTPPPAPSGPNAADMAAASKMAPAQRNEMIEGMVARLAQRLADNGSDVEGWLRLIRAYSVLGDRDKAVAAVANARTALAGNSDNVRRIGELSNELGLEGK
jgi:cytochrome c-type biogenesis protein CcmH